MDMPLPGGITSDDFVDLACAVWKLRRQVFDGKTQQPKDDAGELAPQISAICASLAELGVQIQDHTGNAFQPSQSVEVLAFETKPDVLCEIVTETLRPTVVWHGKTILTGLVIVGQSAPIAQAHQQNV